MAVPVAVAMVAARLERVAAMVMAAGRVAALAAVTAQGRAVVPVAALAWKVAVRTTVARS
ncbi:TPA: hypothetical protein L5S38_003278 [Pseudomonas aeruginosa]|nr:hypothetical protein F3H14_23300 [Pseudomonas aeruginosa]MDE4534749.1 hypothetical protein [Pseudomonas aeruginosa]HBP1138875.1 hypothetical protein [Pseudomonas aeruginosa]HBP6424076.1 hypothetical protein [Pseudomonas aeruginosa]